MLGDCQYSSQQEEEDVGSVNTMCIQVVIIVVHTVSSVSTHMHSLVHNMTLMPAYSIASVSQCGSISQCPTNQTVEKFNARDAI